MPYEDDVEDVEVTVAREIAWLKRERGEETEDQKEWRPQKLHRVKSQGNIVRWDSSLRAVGRSLKEFKMPDIEDIQKRGNPLHWPWLNVCLDGASPNTCATSFLSRVTLLVVTAIWDINHGAWNSEQQTMKDCGLFKWLLLMLVAFNVMHGPWESSERFRESRDRVRMLAKRVDPRQLPAFMMALPDIVRELGWDASDPDIAQKVFDFIMGSQGPLRNKGYKCNLNRFYGFITEGLDALACFAQRGYLTLHVSLESDYLANVEKLRFRPFSADGSGPTSLPGPDERAVRDAAGNCFSIATMMYQDATSRMKLAIVCICGKHNKAWQGIANQELRGVANVGGWLRSQIRSKFMACMMKIIACLHSDVSVAEVGFIIPPPHASHKSWEQGEIAEQDCFATLFYKYAAGLVCNRLVSELWWLFGFPLQSALMTEDTPSARAAVQFLKSALEAFLQFDEKKTRLAGLTSIVKRSVLHNPDVKQLVEILKDAGWKTTPQVMAWAEKRWQGAFQTQICEDGFNREKKEARSQQNNKVGRELLAYQALIQSDVVHLHKYQEVEQRTEYIARGEQFQKSWTTPTIADMSISTKGMVGYNATPKWQSTSRSNMHQGHADLHFMVQIAEEDDFQSVRYAWLGGLFNLHHMMVVRKVDAEAGAEAEKVWFLPLKHVSDSCVIGLPVSLHGPNCGPQVVVFDPECKPVFFAVTGLDEWNAKAFRALSPVGQLLKAEDLALFHLKQFTNIMLFIEGVEEHVLTIAARHAFWQLNVTILRKLAAFQMIELNIGASLFSILNTMISDILDTNDEDTLLDILSKRLGDVDGSDIGYGDILEMEEAAVCLDPNDRDQVKNAKRDHEKDTTQRKTHMDEWLKRKRAAAKKKAKRSSQGGSSSSSSSKSNVKKKEVKALPQNLLEQRSLKPYCSEGGFIWRGNKSGNWNSHFPPFERHSASWALYGMKGSAIRVLRDLWMKYAEVHCLKMPADCPIAGIC